MLRILIIFVVSFCSFHATQYPGIEGVSPRICLQLTNPIARPTTITLNQGPVIGVDATESMEFTFRL